MGTSGREPLSADPHPLATCDSLGNRNLPQQESGAIKSCSTLAVHSEGAWHVPAHRFLYQDVHHSIDYKTRNWQQRTCPIGEEG